MFIGTQERGAGRDKRPAPLRLGGLFPCLLMVLDDPRVVPRRKLPKGAPATWAPPEKPLRMGIVFISAGDSHQRGAFNKAPTEKAAVSSDMQPDDKQYKQYKQKGGDYQKVHFSLLGENYEARRPLECAL